MGVEENQKQVVLNIYDNNLSLEVISKCTELSIEEVETIIKNNR